MRPKDLRDLSDDELARLFRAVHTLKGAAYTVGFSYQNGGSTTNLTGTPDYGARVKALTTSITRIACASLRCRTENSPFANGSFQPM